MNQRNLWLSVALMGLLHACANSTTPERVGGETHFLHACDSEAACGLGLECICGVCTKPCTTDNTCKDQSTSATCEPAGTPSGACDNPQASPVCDVKCTLDSECTTLGPTYTCESGSCRKLDSGSCIAGGVIYADGDQYSLDGCNTCTCNNGNFTCTGLVCMDGGMDAGMDGGSDSGMDGGMDSGPSPGSCLFDNTRYDNGTQFTVDCNTCDCVDGELSCTAVACFSCAPSDTDGGTINLPPVTPPTTSCDFSASPELEVVVTSTDSIRFIALDTDDVYWFAQNDPSPHRTRKEGSRDTATYWYRSASDTISNVAITGCHLYYTQRSTTGGSSGFEVGVTPTDAEDYVRLATVPEPISIDYGRPAILTDSVHVYFAAGSALYRVRRSGGPTVTLSDVGDPNPAQNAFLADANNRIYWLHSDADLTTATDEIRSISKDQSSAPSTLIGGLANPVWMERRGGYLYVGNRGTYDALDNHRHDGSFVRVSLTDGSSTLLTPTGDWFVYVAMDDTHLYWIEPGPTPVFYRTPLDGSTTRTLVPIDPPGSGAHAEPLAVDATHLYFATRCGTSSHFAIVRALKP